MIPYMRAMRVPKIQGAVRCEYTRSWYAVDNIVVGGQGRMRVTSIRDLRR